MKISMRSKCFGEAFIKPAASFLILGFMSFLPLSVSGKGDPDKIKRCELYNGTYHIENSLKKGCIFPQPKWFCPKYSSRPVLIKFKGIQVCFAKAKCQIETCRWENGKRTNDCKRMQTSSVSVFLSCPGFKGQCPKDPNICANSNTKDLSAELVKLFDIGRL